MRRTADARERVFRAAWFSKAARKALIGDEELCSAIRQVMLGQADDLGGGIYKKRLDKNRARSIVLAKGRRFWVYEYLFAKKDRANIGDDELARFRMIATVYAELSDQQVAQLVEGQDWLEICHGN